MTTKQEKRETSTSPKEKEKLKQRLQILFNQQELKAKQNKAAKSVQKPKNVDNKEPQQSSGKPAKKANRQSNSKEQNNELKSAKNKNKNKENGLLDRGIAGNNVNVKEKQSSMQHKQSDSLGGPLESNPKLIKFKKNKNSKPLPSAATLQTDHEVIPKKNKKAKQKHSTNLRKETVAPQPPTQIPTEPKVPLANDGQKKLSKNQKKRAKKRAAIAEPVSIQKNESKKPKLAAQQTKDASKKSKKRNIGQQHSTNGFDVSNMPGLVKGGDFDQDSNEDDDYWNHQDESDISDMTGSVDQVSQEDSYERKTSFNNLDCADYESGDDPYNYSDLSEANEEQDFHESELQENNPFDEDELGDDPYNYSDYNDEEGEEENYSDFDEDDYEEDDDSFSFSSDSEFSSNFDASNDDTEKIYDSADGGAEDEDYKLPEHVPEDLIIHSGTATKRDLLPEDNVKFKDKKYTQIVELKNQTAIKVTHQPKEYQREELLKLTIKENQIIKVASTSSKEVMSSDAKHDDCPKLVPIVDDDGFQLYNPNEEYSDDVDEESMTEEGSFDEYEEVESLGSEYTELNSDDADSLLSEDINYKYINNGCSDEYDSYSSDEENAFMAAQQEVDIIDATKCDYKVGKTVQKYEDESINSDPTPLHTFSKLVKVGSQATIISTPVIDETLLKAKKKKDELATTPNNLDISNLSCNSTESTEKSEDSLNTSTNDQMPDKSAELENKTSVVEVASTSAELEGCEASSKQTKQTANRLKTTAQSLVGYNTLFCNAINANLVLVLLKDPFYIYGTTRLTLLAGTVEVYGHSLAKDKEVELFSPRGCSEIEISSKQTSAKNSISKDKVKNILKHYESNFIKSDLEQIANSFNTEKDAIVLLKRNEDRKKIVQQFKKFMNENVFPNVQNITMDRPLYDSEYLLRCMINISATEHKCLRLPEQWQRFTVTDSSRVMLVGGKGVGKSTLLRFLINKHITLNEQVLLIDLDIGQPEIFVPQTVSCSFVQKPLLGPGFFLNIQPEKSYAVGNTNIALCPHKYVEAVCSLIRYCLAQEKFQNIPWFVNTMGYNKGFGPELISVIASELPLTDIIQLQSNKTINNFDSLLFPIIVKQIPRNMFVEDIGSVKESSQELNYRLHVWQSAVVQESRYQKEWDMSPKDMRYAILLTRLSEGLQGHAEWLSDCKPLSAPLDKLKLLNLIDNIPSSCPDELAKAMEANLVYLCHYEDNLRTVECLGIGVVRAIDYHVQQLYLLPAIPSPSILKQVNCLALGEMPLPSSLLTNQGSRVQKIAPFVYNTVEAKASKAIKQIYHRPTKFLKGKHKSLD